MEEPVAFTVTLNGDFAPSAGEKIPYNKIVTNVGHGYITERREFVCPQAGLYVFYAAGYAKNGATCYLDIRKNDILISNMFFTENHHTMGSNMAVLELVEADNVSIISANSGCQLHGTYVFTTFSGFRIN